jgi:hypothetical protein
MYAGRKTGTVLLFAALQHNNQLSELSNSNSGLIIKTQLDFNNN